MVCNGLSLSDSSGTDVRPLNLSVCVCVGVAVFAAADVADVAQGVLGVIDGVVPTDFETDEDKKARHDFLRAIGYKR